MTYNVLMGMLNPTHSSSYQRLSLDKTFGTWPDLECCSKVAFLMHKLKVI